MACSSVTHTIGNLECLSVAYRQECNDESLTWIGMAKYIDIIVHCDIESLR